MPASMQRATAAAASARGGSISPTSPSSLARPRNGSTPAWPWISASSTSAIARTRNARAAIASTGGVGWSAHSGRIASAAPLSTTREPCWVAISFVAGSNGISAHRGWAARSASGASPALIASVTSAASVGSPTVRQLGSRSSGPTTCASLHSTPASISGRTSSARGTSPVGA